MAKKKKKKLNKVSLVKAMSRAALGAPPVTRSTPTLHERSQRKQSKHRPTLAKLLDQE